MRALVALSASALVLVATMALAQDSGPKGIAASAVKWGPAPNALPKGGEMAGLSGDATKPGPFTVRLKMPADYKIPAHKHPHTERVTVISGELYFGTGDKLDEKGATNLGSGASSNYLLTPTIMPSPKSRQSFKLLAKDHLASCT